MNIYDVDQIEHELEVIAKANEGEIPEEKFQELVEAQTKSIDTVDRMCKYIRHLEMYSDTCKSEAARIKGLKERADKRIESIKKYMSPFVQKKGKFTAGIFTLSMRKSTSVELDDGFFNATYCKVIETVKADKPLIKKMLKNGVKIKGARLVDKQNLQMK